MQILEDQKVSKSKTPLVPSTFFDKEHSAIPEHILILVTIWVTFLTDSVVCHPLYYCSLNPD